MSTFTEFCLIALVLYLWESTLWLPLRSMVLRKNQRSKAWGTLPPDRWLALRETGMVPLPPLIGSGRIAPCQAPPFIVDDTGHWLLEASDGRRIPIPAPTWEEIEAKQHHLNVGKRNTRLSSPRILSSLKRARKRGLTPAEAVRLSWRLALSPIRAGREWKRWRMVSSPLGWMCCMLTCGFFIGLPLSYLYLGNFRTLCFAFWLWTLMLFIAGHLWWLGRRVYPAARAALRMDALLAVIVPFHAMRAREIASVHAMGATHPVALMLSTGDTANPWLSRWIRQILHPRPEMPTDAVFSASVLPMLIQHGLRPGDYSSPPNRLG